MVSLMTTFIFWGAVKGNKWDCGNDFQWILQLHERGALLNSDKLTCQPIPLQMVSWINLSYSVITQEITRKVKCCYHPYSE